MKFNVQLLAVPVFVALILAMAGCKQIALKDGQIPEAFVDQARVLEGDYEGYVAVNDATGISQDLRAAVLTLKLDGTRPVLTASRDVLGDGCESTIGQILNARVSKAKLKSVSFAFDNGKCKTPEMSDRLIVDLASQPNGKFVLKTALITGEKKIVNLAGETLSSPIIVQGTFKQK